MSALYFGYCVNIYGLVNGGHLAAYDQLTRGDHDLHTLYMKPHFLKPTVQIRVLLVHVYAITDRPPTFTEVCPFHFWGLYSCVRALLHTHTYTNNFSIWVFNCACVHTCTSVLPYFCTSVLLYFCTMCHVCGHTRSNYNEINAFCPYVMSCYAFS